MKTRYIIPILIVTLVLAVSCRKDFEDIDTNPEGFTTATTGSLFNTVIKSLMLPWNEMMYISNEILYKETQLAALGATAWGNYEIGTKDIWQNYYQALAHIREIERRLAEMDTSAAAANVAAVLKIVKAYKTFKLTDLFGDIPYFDAGYGFLDVEYLYPKYDSQEEIYKSLLNDLKWANDTIDETASDLEPYASFQNFDNLLHGDLYKWRQFANSMRLRYALRMYDKTPDFAGEVIAEVLDNNLPLVYGFNFTSFLGESITLTPSNLGLSNDGYHWSFREHKNLRMGSNLFAQMSINDNIDGSGIFDARAYYFFETNNANEWMPFPQLTMGGEAPIGGAPYAEKRDSEEGFSDKGEGCVYSPFNFFLVRDADNMPEILMTGAEVHFMKAEIYLRGLGVPASPYMAEIEYQNGVQSSLTFWTETMDNSTLPLAMNPDFFSWYQVPSHLDFITLIGAVGFQLDDDDDEKLKKIITQRWIDNFRQPWEAFALTRQSDFTPREGDPISYFRLPYPASEINYNYENMQQANGGAENTSDVKVWWMN